ncbi:MarR family winged helix-turn-helix transcriptional regulator [Agrobacterium sp. ST15.13.015]|uniref:MarR family winged helix-turn-helix transcriptional regulator n=1 Tax=Agrobacterium sp. ST15.13.015 TaxID=3017319 RepID=UPI0022BB456F|nr:MarR family transcriptional regulator [Agrobacterium sp. ST15.13.015]MCZ7500982.1 MarR family transcriptional regulator [Rhizobium rhizogenes]
MTKEKETAEAALTMALSIAARKMRNVFDARVRTKGLTLAKARALQYLARHDNVSQRDLANHLEIEHPSVVRLLDGLAKQGLIVRRPMDGDRRANRIELTKTSRELVADLDKITKTMRKDLLDGLDQEALASALSVLQKIADRGDALLGGKTG